MKPSLFQRGGTPATARTKIVAALVLAASLVAFSGCTRAGSGPSPGITTTAAADRLRPLADREIWEVLRIGRARVGYGRTAIHTGSANGTRLVHVNGLTRMKFNRAGRQVELGIQLRSLQGLDGGLVEFESVISQGSTPIRQTRGRVAGGKLNLQTTTQGKTLSTSLPWLPGFGGPFASQLGLLEQPMTPGQTRTVRELVPEANVVGIVEMVARDFEPVDVLGRTHRLLRIETTTTFPDEGRQQATIWTDRSGDVLRTLEQAMKLESLRATREVALAGFDQAEFDLVLGLSVPVDRRLERPHDTTRVRYRLHLEGDDPAKVFAAGPSQQIRSIDEHTAELTVYAIRPDWPAGRRTPAEEPTDADLAPNNMIQSDDPKITAAARQIADDQKDPWQIALALERYVGRKITATNYSQAFDTAAEVMRTGEGDCTEHAVLLAALARACGIPARVVIGLVYTTETGGPAFGYHMWNELYVHDRWIPMDATLARGGIGAAHLKLTDTDLEGASALSSFLPVAQVAGRLRIEIEEVE